VFSQGFPWSSQGFPGVFPKVSFMFPHWSTHSQGLRRLASRRQQWGTVERGHARTESRIPEPGNPVNW
jgi:hypothetical protein